MPTPGGPHEGEDRARTAGTGLGHAALGAQLAHREVLDDPVFHVVETGVVGVEDRARVGDVELVVGARAPRNLERGVDPRPDPPVLRALFAGALEPIDLARDRLTGRVGKLHFLELGPVAVDDIFVVARLPQLLADRRELLAQQEVALGLVHVVADALTDLIRHLELRERVARPTERLLEARFGVERLQQLDLALHGQVGRPARGVGQRADVVDALQGVGEAR